MHVGLVQVQLYQLHTCLEDLDVACGETNTVNTAKEMVLENLLVLAM